MRSVAGKRQEQPIGSVARETFSRLLTVYGTGLVLMFFSEYYFFNEGPVGDLMNLFTGVEGAGVIGYIEFTVFYAFFAAWFLLPVYYFRVRSFWALYLAGGFFGIATEGLVVPLIYTESLTWPALSWHVFVDVILGWYIVRAVLAKNNPLYTGLLACCMGLFWAFWVPWTHIGSEPFIPDPSQFTIFALFSSAGLLFGYVLLSWTRRNPFRPGRIEFGVLGILTLMLWLPMLIGTWIPMIAEKPGNSLALPAFLGISVYTLQRHRRVEIKANLMSVFRAGTAWWNMALFTLMPLTAISAYPFVYRSQLFPPTASIVTLLNTSAYIMIPMSVFMLWRDINAHYAKQSPVTGK